MKLWGWWKKDSQPEKKEQPPQEKVHIKPEDLEGKQALQNAAHPSIKDTLKTINSDDFKNINKIPCMRSAMLTGAGIGSTAGLVMYLSRRPLSKAVNWAFAGFFIGSIFSWEQCRFRRRQGKKNVINARQQYSNKD